MAVVVVTGAAGAVGRRVMDRLADSRFGAVHGLDRRPVSTGSPSTPDQTSIHQHQVDLATIEPDDLAGLVGVCETIVHLADETPSTAGRPRPEQAATRAVELLERVLESADAMGCHHLVLLSSALVYGAHPDNPMPLTEAHRARPLPDLAFATTKAALERRATQWAEETDSALAVLRPTATLSEGDSSWVGAAIRAAASVRPEGVDPPFQFLHHDDLADAVVLAADRRLDGIHNVAPDGWIGAELFRGLRGETQVGLPERVGWWRNRVAKAVAGTGLLDGLEPHLTHPWVVANDKLKAAGWEPAYTNAEAYVAGTPPPLLGTVAPQRRQEVALGVVGTAGVVAVGAVAWALNRLGRR